jgi:hypothetical protein
VLKDAEDNTLGSGVVWPVPGSPVSVGITRRPPAPRPPVFRSEGHPADGRRRVFVAILDCADWRLIQYLRHRGELPVLDTLLQLGQRSVLISDPPFTAAAMRSIANPGDQGVSSFMGLLYQLGTEIEGLNFIGVNPFEPLRWVTPAGGDLFTALGGTQLAVVNMLHSYGPIQAGRNAQMIGPFGRVREISGLRGSRLLRPEERQRFTGLLEVDDAGRGLIEEMVADFDALDALVAQPDADLVMLRVASLDVFTHAQFAKVVVSGQDDGDQPLLWFYRYMDERLGGLFNALDDDDILIVMSDHGIRTALEHDKHCFFVAAGGGVPSGRVPDSPNLRGTGLMLADLFGVKTEWPATGMESWVPEIKTAD